MTSPRLGFVGAGKMAGALARGFIEAGLATAESIAAYDPVAAAGEAFTKNTGAKLVGSNRAVAGEAEVLFLAVKPQQMPAVYQELREAAAGKLVVSIAAGVTLAALAAGLGPKARYIRVMPNTPALVGRGASAYALGPGATADDAALVDRLLNAVGRAYRLDEKLLDAVTGLSGSGPAFVYVIIEALSDGGVRMGLPRDIATGLAAQTVLGAAAMVLETGEHPGVLKDQVTSPGGTTIAGLQALEQGAVRGDLIAAVEAATRRAMELGKSS
ncbi:MAG: pyrroline-5-carboxylate reductase [Planctomycetia bacterium]|nr:pyrroline-5-carboxylate reductase [Planctomycetia bacterium]